MLYLGLKMQRNGDLTNHIKERLKSKCGDETSKGSWRMKILRRLQKKDDVVRQSNCGSHVVQDWTFRLEGKNSMWKNTTEIYKMVFGFGKIHSRLYEREKQKEIRSGSEHDREQCNMKKE